MRMAPSSKDGRHIRPVGQELLMRKDGGLDFGALKPATRYTPCGR